MTVKCLKDVSTMLVIVSAVRKGVLKGHFSAEREIFKLMLSFDYIKYAGYITSYLYVCICMYVYLNNLLRILYN